MSYSCPLSFEKVDSNVSRINSFLVSTLLLSYLLTFNVVIVYFLLFEFITRLFCNNELSLLYKMAKFLKKSFKLKDKPTDSGAKRLAGYFAIFFLLLLVAGNNLNLYLFSMVVGGIFLSCSLLDVFFNFCVGCKIYFIVKKIYPSFMS